MTYLPVWGEGRSRTGSKASSLGGTERDQHPWRGSCGGLQGDLGEIQGGGRKIVSGEEGEAPETRVGTMLVPVPTPALEKVAANPWGALYPEIVAC